jgi:histidine triad (HIT) family protein
VPEFDPDCLFCRIVTGDLESVVVATSDRSFAFRDTTPQAPTHVLVVPRRHIDDASSLGEGDGDDLADLFALANEVASEEGIAKSGYRLVFNVGDDAHNSVGHLHLHVLGGHDMAGRLG